MPATDAACTDKVPANWLRTPACRMQLGVNYWDEHLYKPIRPRFVRVVEKLSKYYCVVHAPVYGSFHACVRACLNTSFFERECLNTSMRK